MTVRQPYIGLFVDSSTHQRVVGDRDGRFRGVPPVKAPWQYRQSFEPDVQTDLEPIPKHYSYLLDLKI